MKYEIRKAEDVTLFVLQGDIAFNQVKELSETILGEMTRSSTNKFIIDLGETVMINSGGVGFIVSMSKIVASNNGTFAISRPNELVSSVLRTLGLTRLFKIYATEDEAIMAMNHSRQK